MHFHMYRALRSVSLLVISSSVALFAPLAFAYADVSVSIQSLSPSNTVTVGTTVSFSVTETGFTNPTYTITDPTSGSSITTNDINSSGNFSWTPESIDVGTHSLTITVNDAQGDTANTQESITVNPTPTLTLGSLSPGTSITAGQTVSFAATTNGFTNPTFSVSDSLNGSSVSNNDINPSTGAFSWTPASNQTGTHTITMYATDALGHSANATETIIVGSTPVVAIQSLSPGSSVGVGQNVTFTALASNFNDPSYTVSDTFGNSSVSDNNINSSGQFSWTPETSDIGTHTITVTVNDASGHSSTATQTITVSSSSVVSGTGGATVQGLSPGTNVIIGQPVSFTVAASGFSNPVFSAQDSFSGSTMTGSDINSAGYFSWTPTSSDTGTHTITVYVNDSSGHTGNVTLQLTVNQPNITITSINPGTTVLENSLLTFNVTPAGFTNPTYTLSDSFSGTTISTSNINSSGQFSWTALASQVGTHTITVSATDASGHNTTTQLVIDVTASGTAVTPTTTSSASLSTLETELAQAEAALQAAQGTSGSSATSQLTENLSFGMTDDQVTILQNLLAAHGYFSGTATGYFGGQTQAAVERFQSANGISPIGIVGPATREALNSLSTTATASTSTGDGYVFSNFIGMGSTGTDVTELQKRLTALGFYSGPVTGTFGSLTQAAVKAFQAAHGITQAGYVGPGTRAALNQ